ncbi:MAG: hypothetical protein KA125_06420 [Chromatiaceae bacterium]|nr:hypothetical protein [Chromatiaceae bacterium]
MTSWISHEVTAKLIGSPRTRNGLTIQSELDTTPYPIGIKVSDEEPSKVNLTRASFHGEWNYAIAPCCSG